MQTYLFSIPFLCAFIGWFANWLLIQSIFHPIKPIKILGFNWQGILPKKQNEMAEKATALVNQFLPFAAMEEKISGKESFQKIMPLIEVHLNDFLKNKLKEKMPVIGMFIGEKTISQLKETFMVELENLFPIIMKNYLQNLKKDLNLEEIVKSKITAISVLQVKHRVQNQLRILTLAGALCGFVIGLIYLLFFYFIA
ncbi:MAG: DUF445 domain-containing protein [Chitinophagaceae bacterium]